PHRRQHRRIDGVERGHPPRDRGDRGVRGDVRVHLPVVEPDPCAPEGRGTEGDAVSASSRLLAIALVGILVLGGAAGLSVASGPHAVVPGAPQMTSFAPAAHASVAPLATPASTSHPASGCTPTPGGTPNWNNDPNFFDDALVTCSVPGDRAISGSNFDILPCDNVIPTYENGFWMNVSTSVPLTAAYVKIWGTTWPTPGVAAGAL